MKNRLLPISLLVLAFVGYVLLEVFGPKGDDWSPKYGNDHDEPFGSMLVYEGLADLFPDNSIRAVDIAPSEQLVEFSENASNYIIIQHTLDVEREDAEALIRYVENGNQVFIAAAAFEGALGDSLDLDSDSFWDIVDGEEFSKDDFVTFTEEYDSEEKHYPLLDNIYYDKVPSWNSSEILSHNRDGRSVFVRLDRGEGAFFIHSIPLLFTNYSMVDPVNQEYIARSFSFLPPQTTYWDEYYKPGKLHMKSPVNFILNQRSLQWSWYLLLATIVLFIIFEGKRRQRVIPLVEPPANDTLEFTKTVGRLYFLHGDHKDIAEKKIKFLNEYIRNRWGIPTRSYNPDFRQRLSQKSGVKRAVIDQIFDAAEKIADLKKIDQPTLHHLHAQIEEFYQKSK